MIDEYRCLYWQYWLGTEYVQYVVKRVDGQIYDIVYCIPNECFIKEDSFIQAEILNTPDIPYISDYYKTYNK